MTNYYIFLVTRAKVNWKVLVITNDYVTYNIALEKGTYCQQPEFSKNPLSARTMSALLVGYSRVWRRERRRSRSWQRLRVAEAAISAVSDLVRISCVKDRRVWFHRVEKIEWSCLEKNMLTKAPVSCDYYKNGTQLQETDVRICFLL